MPFWDGVDGGAAVYGWVGDGLWLGPLSLAGLDFAAYLQVAVNLSLHRHGQGSAIGKYGEVKETIGIGVVTVVQPLVVSWWWWLALSHCGHHLHRGRDWMVVAVQQPSTAPRIRLSFPIRFCCDIMRSQGNEPGEFCPRNQAKSSWWLCWSQPWSTSR